MFWKLENVFWSGIVSSHSEKGVKGYIGPSQNLAVVVLFMCLSELPTLGRNFRPVIFQLAERILSETT